MNALKPPQTFTRTLAKVRNGESVKFITRSRDEYLAILSWLGRDWRWHRRTRFYREASQGAA